MKEIKRFDFDKKPLKEKWYLTPLKYLLALPEVWLRKTKVNKVNMEGVKPPYIILCTHHAFVDFKVLTKAIFPHPANYIVAIDGFIKREWLLRNVGGICKRKFVNDIKLVKHIKYSLEELKSIVAIFPEARYSLIGTNAILPESLGKMIKMLKYDVVVLNMHGNHLSQPVWNLKKRKVRLEADMTKVISKEELTNLTVEEINDIINKAFIYDEYQWQKSNNIKITAKNRAEGLHKVLYKCPHCLVEHQMNSLGKNLFCEACKVNYEMSEVGELKATNAKTIFSHIPDWYEFERAEVKKELLAGTYHFEDKVRIESLPNSKGYLKLGEGYLKHDENGFLLTADNPETSLELLKEPLTLYSLHIEYNYFNKGDCLDLSTIDDTYYIYPLTKTNVVTKLHFAVEELYKLKMKELRQKSASFPTN